MTPQPVGKPLARDGWGYWAENILIMAGAAVLSIIAGRQALLRYGLVNWDGLAAVAHAYDVFHKLPGAHLTLLGFVQPPLPGLVAAGAVALSPRMTQPALLPSVIGAVLLGLSALMIRNIGRQVGLGIYVPWLFVILFLFKPVVLSYAAGGAPAMLLIVLLLGAAFALSRWGDGQRFRDLLAASLFLAAAIITRYEVVFVVIAVALYVAVRSAQKGDWRRVEGTLIAFLLPIAYVAAGWMGACWAIKGDPWLFWRYTFTEAPTGPLTHFYTATGEVVRIILVCGALLVPAAYYALLNHTLRARAAGPLVVVAGSGAAGILLGRLHSSLPGDSWAQLTVLTAASVAVGLLMIMLAIAHLARGDAPRRGLVGAIVLLVALAILNTYLSTTRPTVPWNPSPALHGYISFAGDARPELATARRLSKDLGESRQAVIAGWPGFAIALFTRQVDKITVYAEGQTPPAHLELHSGDLVVLHSGDSEPAQVWGRRLPPGLQLQQRWRKGPWIGYEVEQGSAFREAGSGKTAPGQG